MKKETSERTSLENTGGAIHDHNSIKEMLARGTAFGSFAAHQTTHFSLMKMMKNFSLTALLSLAMFGTVTFTSCSRDECKDVVCQNGGTCDENDGSCTCATGYEGDLCQTRIADKFVGTWSVTETCGTTPSTPYQVVITATGASNPTQILLSNLGNYGCTVGGNIVFTGVVNGSTTFTVNDNKCSTQMVANGTLNTNGSITVTYTATFTGGSDNCTATLTK